MYINEINPHPTQDYDKVVDFLLALRPRKQERAELLKINGTALRMLSRYDVIGAGDVIRYIAEGSFKPDMPISQGVLLGAHLVSQAKKYVEGCGGPTHTLIVTSDGRTQFERVEETERKECFFEEFNEALKGLALSCADTSMPNDFVLQQIDAFTQRIKELRERHVLKEFEENLIVAITDPDRYQGDVYPKLPLGFTGHLPDRVLRLMVERNEEIYKQAATKQGTSYGPATSDSQKSEDEL